MIGKRHEGLLGWSYAHESLAVYVETVLATKKQLFNPKTHTVGAPT